MKRYQKTAIYILSLLIVVSTVAPTQSTPRFLQETARSAAVTKMCASFSGRTLEALVDANTIAQAQLNMKVFQSSLTISGSDTIGGILKDFSSVGATLPTIVNGITSFIAPGIIGLIIIVLVSPFLLCCCCCPGSCPPKSCQKPQNEQYTKIQLIWPTIALIVALIIAIATTATVVARASNIQNSFTAVGCSITMAIDDILNGNTSSVGTYWMGINTLVKGLQDMKTNSNSLKTQMNKIRLLNVTGAIAPAYSTGDELLKLIRKLPHGTTENITATGWNYRNFDGTAATIASNFPTELGNAGGTTPTKQLNASYIPIQNVFFDLFDWGYIAEGLYQKADNLGQILDPALAGVKPIVTMIQGYGNLIAGDDISNLMKSVTVFLTIIFVIAIVLGMLGLIGALFATFSQKYGCRKLTYFVCVLLFIIGIISFILAILFSILSPVLFLACDFLAVTISSGASFSNSVGALLGQNANLIGACLPGGNGNLIAAMPIDVAAIDDLTKFVKGLRDYNATAVQNQVQASLDQLTNFIDKYYYTDLYDFTSAPNSAMLLKLATPSDTAYDGCTANNFANDNWIPSLRQTSINCSNTVTHKASSTQCPTSSKIQIGKGSGATVSDCYGCMDSTKIFYNSPDIRTDLIARYNTGGECTTWADDMEKSWVNYYSVKKTGIDPIRTRMENIQNSYNTPTTGYKARIGSLPPQFSQVIYNLQQSIPRIFHRVYGIADGLNCLVIGDDLNLIVNTMCTSFYNSVFGFRVPLLLAGFAICFVMCCSTCSGVRAFKQQQRRGYVGIQPAK